MDYVKNILITILCASLIGTEAHAWPSFNFQPRLNALCNYVKKHPLQSLVVSTAVSASLAFALYRTYQHLKQKK